MMGNRFENETIQLDMRIISNQSAEITLNANAQRALFMIGSIVIDFNQLNKNEMKDSFTLRGI